MLAVKGLNQYYGESHTLWDIDLNLRPGVCTCILGRNGMGKTTLLKSLMGLLPVRSGSILCDEKELSGMRTNQRVKEGIAYVPQGREIFPQLTVEENLRLGFTAKSDYDKSLLDRYYELFPVLKKMSKRRGGNLSGGQQQQLALARVLVLGPKLLILDEPTEGIQPNIVHEIGDIIMRLVAEENITVLLVEQKLPFTRRVGQQFYLMDTGRIVADGEMDALNDDLIERHLQV
jgi:urea transport system ATP-binding protein